MFVHGNNGCRLGRIAALAGASMVLAAAFAGAQAAERERNTDARMDANSRNTGTTYLRTEERQQKKKKAKIEAATPKKKGPMDPN
jgi:hypothetical protein